MNGQIKEAGGTIFNEAGRDGTNSNDFVFAYPMVINWRKGCKSRSITGIYIPFFTAYQRIQ